MEENQFADFFSLMANHDDLWYQSFADDIPALIFVLDPGKKKLNYINKQFTDVLGYTADDLRSCDYDVTRFLFRENDVAAFL
ncbi:PAS domain-containing protein, partial [Aetokthonos hydrillicola]|uniref:PAS domain-containing protein n=1 Tax=Aetokthonos hydrillicola TaxID=1550245 RepID=UPI001ABB340C